MVVRALTAMTGLLDQSLNWIQLGCAGLGVVALGAAVMTRQRGWAVLRGQILLGVVALAIALAIYVRWEHRYDAFRELGSRLESRRGPCPASLAADPDVAAVAARVAIEVDRQAQEIVWPGFSMRRRLAYNCRTGAFALH
jgi:hypothetical protein